MDIGVEEGLTVESASRLVDQYVHSADVDNIDDDNDIVEDNNEFSVILFTQTKNGIPVIMSKTEKIRPSCGTTSVNFDCISIKKGFQTGRMKTLNNQL